MGNLLTKKRQDIEIMSPAGSFEAIDAAIEAGAGSIYFGVGQLNMRAAMEVSFQPEDLPKIAEKCQQHGLKSYLALNIVLFDEELAKAKLLVEKAKNAGISAVIACDHAILNHCKKIGMPAHISTQANITNTEEVEYFSRFADTMVLGREMTLEQISNIVRGIEERQIRGPSGNFVRIEVFVHGYFCMAISGKCYLSIAMHNTSANRGECQIPCKNQYIVKDARTDTELLIENEHIMSAKDLCTIDFIDKILETGVSVLKIEGRKKSEEYVFVTTKCYKEAVDAYFDGTYNAENIKKWRIYLATVFNRGFWRGYYLGEHLKEYEISGDPKLRIIEDTVQVAEVLKYDEDKNLVKLKVVNRPLKKNDDLLIVDPKVGAFEKKVAKIFVENQEVAYAKPGVVCDVQIPISLSKGTKVIKIRFRKDKPFVSFLYKSLRRLIGDRAYQTISKALKS